VLNEVGLFESCIWHSYNINTTLIQRMRQMEREAYFDNAKLVLIFLVVFGHMIQPFIDDSRSLNTFYMWVYTFHMPAFIFLSGFFAKGSGNIKYIVRLAKKLLLPYIIFQLIYTGYYYFIGKASWQTDIFYPHWSLWFLFSLFSWHILLIVFKKLPPVLSIIIAVQMGIIVGYFSEVGHTYSLSRTIVFFPFFLTGYWLTKKQFMHIKHRFVKIASVIVMGVIAVAIYIAPEFNSGWLLASKSYGDLGLPVHGGFARFLVYMTSTLMAISVLAWLPKKRMRFTYLGERTLYVYLLHGFFIQYFREANMFQMNDIFDFIGLAVLSALIVILLASKPMVGMWQPFIEGKATIIRRVFRQRE